MAQVTQLSLYIINRVKLLRLVRGIPASRLSLFLKTTGAYIFNVEKESLDTQYPTERWPQLAEGLKCKVHDLLPPDEMDQASTGQLVDKKVLSLNDEGDVDLILSELVKYNFFNTSKSLGDVVKHLFIKDDRQSHLVLNALSHQVVSKALIQIDERYINAH